MSFLSSLKEKRLRRKGQKFLTKGKIEKAYLIFQKALLINDSVENIFNISMALMSIGRYSEAEKYLLKVNEDFPENELTMLSLAECLIMQKKWNEAISYYEKVAEHNSNLQKYLNIAKDSIAREKYVKSKQLFNKATIALKKREDEVALNTLIEAEEYFPDHPGNLHNIGSIYFLMKKYEKAYQYILKAHSLDKTNPKFQKSLSSVKRKLKKPAFGFFR